MTFSHSSILSIIIHHASSFIIQHPSSISSSYPYYTQESTIFCTVHCPENRYLLASSNQGRLAIWDLSHYLFPSKAASSWTTDASSIDPTGPHNKSLRLSNFRKELQCNQVRVYPAEFLRKGYPRLSLQVSRR